MTKILAFSGKKQSGKTSGAHFVSAYVISQIARLNPSAPLFKHFIQNEEGKIVVNANIGDVTEEYSGIINLSREDNEFSTFASQYIWPYVKIYSFANKLKSLCVNIFNIAPELCYGSDADKNKNTQYTWEFVSNIIPGFAEYKVTDNEFVTGREFMELIGTCLFRKFYDEVWIQNTIKDIEREQPEIAIIDDCRFLNEANFLKKYDTLIIKLDRNKKSKSIAKSETEPDLINDVADLVIPDKLDLHTKNQTILNFLYEKKWFTKHINL